MTKFVKNPDEIVLEDVKMYHLNIGGDNLYVNYSYEGTINELN